MSFVTGISRQLLKPGQLLKCVTSSLHTQGSPLLFKATEVLSSAPMKKKKRVDPHTIQLRYQKKIKMLEREMKKLTKRKRRLKPIVEIASVTQMRKETESRLRENVIVTDEEQGERILLGKEWSKDRISLHKKEMSVLRDCIASQQLALDELREESEELYQQAIQIDESLIPYTFKGPVRTPPIPDYDSPDGVYNDTTKTYD